MTAISLPAALANTVSGPPLRKRDNWVAVKPGQFDRSADPISATVDPR
jgi:hypothetical protein